MPISYPPPSTVASAGSHVCWNAIARLCYTRISMCLMILPAVAEVGTRFFGAPFYTQNEYV
eukprot:COSAG06_NODE_50192_length_320_cov_0.927602_1_plen_60_part_01